MPFPMCFGILHHYRRYHCMEVRPIRSIQFHRCRMNRTEVTLRRLLLSSRLRARAGETLSWTLKLAKDYFPYKVCWALGCKHEVSSWSLFCQKLLTHLSCWNFKLSQHYKDFVQNWRACGLPSLLQTCFPHFWALDYIGSLEILTHFGERPLY